MKILKEFEKRFSNFRNQIFGPEIQNRNRISSFEVPIFQFFGQILNCYPQNSKSKSNFNFWCQEFSFSRNQILKNRNFKFWQRRFLHFHPISNQNFQILGSIYEIFSRISLNTRKFCSPNFSSTLARRGCLIEAGDMPTFAALHSIIKI